MMKALLSLALAAALAGCAGMQSLSSDVTSYGDWPAGRKPGTYAFDRLPSQEAQATSTEQLESAARPALAKAGFQPVAAGQEPDVLVQVGVRATRTDRYAWDDPLWWRGGFGRWRYGPWGGPYWGMSTRIDYPRYEREVAVLMRDRPSGKPIFEAHASNESGTLMHPTVLTAMFEAALMDFPRTGVNPRQVVVKLAD